MTEELARAALYWATLDSGNGEMPLAGQQALVNYVQGGGAHLGTEWNSYEMTYANRLSAMRDLVLFDYGFYYTQRDITLSVVSGTVIDGRLHPFSTDPAADPESRKGEGNSGGGPYFYIFTIFSYFCDVVVGSSTIYTPTGMMNSAVIVKLT